MSEIKPITLSDSAYVDVRDAIMDPVMRSLAFPLEVLRKPATITPTPDHVWLRTILLDPSPATFAAWSDWLRENLRDEEAEIAAVGRVPAVPASFVWRCVGMLDGVTYSPGSWDKRFAGDMVSRLQVRARTMADAWKGKMAWVEMVIATVDPIYWITAKQLSQVMRLAWKYRRQHGNERLAAEARWVLYGDAPDGRGG